LEDGQSITWFLPLDQWMQANTESMLRAAAWLHMRTMYLQVFTSKGAAPNGENRPLAS
jgi:hypothetical protein